MKTANCIFFFLLILLTAITVVVVYRNSPKKTEILPIRDANLDQGFTVTLNKAGNFYKLFRDALDSSEREDNETAIELFNSAIPLAKIGIEKGMVYYELIKIYHKTGNLEQELKYLELLPKYSMNEKDNQEAVERAAEIKREKKKGVTPN